jgi:glycine betaine catabolism B
MAFPSKWKWARASAPPKGGPFVKAAVRTVTPHSVDIWTIRIDAALSYSPGHAVKVQIPGDPTPRYFSISSSPTETGYIEITVKTDAAGQFAEAIRGLERGTMMEVDGPFGKFSLPPSYDMPLCFIAAGTGITPFRSMVKYLIDHDEKVESWLLHSVKFQRDLLFMNEFRDWSGMNKGFHYVPTITQDVDDNWENETGRINETLIRKHIPKKSACFLLCGPPTFVSDIEKLLTSSLKVPVELIRREQW